MISADEKDIYIDPDIPAEQQITFLRQHAITSKIDAFEVLKDGGEEGVEVFKNILRKGYKRITEMTEGLDFQMLASLAGFSDKMMGLQTEMDYSNSDEFQYSISYCPYLEECKRRGLDMEFCHVFENVYMEEISKKLGEFTEPSRMCDGDKKCTFRMKNTFGR
jgi:hypothetical protein